MGQDLVQTAETIISVRGLAKRFGSKQIWTDLSLDVMRGEILAVVGGSGQGKSVLLRVITGLVKPDAGSIQIFGRDVNKLTPQETVENALRDAAKNALAPPAELETAHCVFAHVVGDREMPLDDARRVLPVLESLFPKAETGCGISVDEAASGIQATIIAGKLEGPVVNPAERRRTLRAESPFFKVGNPTVYDGENLDIPTFIRADVRLPGSPPRPVPEQGSLFEPSRSRV